MAANKQHGGIAQYFVLIAVTDHLLQETWGILFAGNSQHGDGA
jgi:hypothetical protein